MWEDLESAFVYELPPVDWWYGWSQLDEALPQDNGDPKSHERIRAELKRIREHAFSEFRKRTLWEGDIVTGPVFAGLPPADGNPDCDVMVAIKQRNNGTVFVWSPYELPWLSPYAS